MVDTSISSPTKKYIKTKERNGERKIKFDIFEIFDVRLTAFGQNTKVIPISKNPIYTAPKLASKFGSEIPPIKQIYILINITPTKKFENNPTVASTFDFVLNIQ